MKYIKYFLVLFLTIMINFNVEAKEIVLQEGYSIDVDDSFSGNTYLSDGYFSCKYSGVRRRNDSVVYVVFIDDTIYMKSAPSTYDSQSIIDNDELVFRLDDNAYILKTSSNTDATIIFKDIMYDNEGASYDDKNFLYEAFSTTDIYHAKLRVDSFSTYSGTTSICPQYLNINEIEKGKHEYLLSNDTTGSFYLQNAGMTEIEKELVECVNEEECDVSGAKNESNNELDKNNISCAYKYKYKINDLEDSEQCAIFNFKKEENGEGYSLSISDPINGVKHYDATTSVTNGAKPNKFLNGDKCYEKLYVSFKNGYPVWFNPDDGAKDVYGTPETMTYTNASTCDPVKDDDDTYIPDYSIDLSGCIIDAGTREIIDWIMNLIRLVGIILLIVLGMLDFIKAAASGEQEVMNKSKEHFVKRLIACVALFLAPIFVDLILSLVNIASDANGDCNSRVETSSNNNQSGDSQTHTSSSGREHGGGGRGF